MSDHDHSSHGAYFKVFGALMFLTVVTVVASFEIFHIGDVGNMVIAMFIATIKASLVATIFMHLWFEVGRWKFVLLVPPMVLFFVLVMALTPDVANKPTRAEKAQHGPGDAGHH